AMIEHAADGIILLDENNRIILVNTAAESMLKKKSTDLQSQSLDVLHAPSSWLGFSAILNTLGLNSPTTVETFFRIQGIELPVEIRLARYKVLDQVETLLLIRDISERREAEEHIHRLAYYDSVTRLPN
ncbi:PAS domain S-box protein, partial [Escherichia coli]|uniref:PAS domain S-box protein n=1 Tax=Escherichia coli TaxID=562 RepID=UPI003FA587B5